MTDGNRTRSERDTISRASITPQSQRKQRDSNPQGFSGPSRFLDGVPHQWQRFQRPRDSSIYLLVRTLPWTQRAMSESNRPYDCFAGSPSQPVRLWLRAESQGIEPCRAGTLISLAARLLANRLLSRVRPSGVEPPSVLYQSTVLTVELRAINPAARRVSLRWNSATPTGGPSHPFVGPFRRKGGSRRS